MKRLLINDLIKWKAKRDRKPLILNGARQVGKTWLLQHFGVTEYQSVAYINCEKQDNLDQIFFNFDTSRMIRALSATADVDIQPGTTLIILDEIQEYPRALTALKYFCEDAPQYHIAVAGSLLGISLHQGISFPVGKVEVMNLYPMDFEEFLLALEKEQLVKVLYEQDWETMNAASSLFIELLRQYFFVGGMPGVVSAYLGGAGPEGVRVIQNQILNDYQMDFSKHAESREVPRIQLVWDSVPHQLAKENKKFQYSELKKGGRANEFAVAIEWLLQAGLVYKVHRINKLNMPIKFYQEQNVFKLFALDVGLLGAQIGAPASKILVGDDVFVEYKGAFAEAFVLSQLVPCEMPISYYSTNDSQVEIDFVVQTDERIIPIEVKAATNVRSKSLRTFINSHSEFKGLRISMKPYQDEGWMENIPLYAISAYFSKKSSFVGK